MTNRIGLAILFLACSPCLNIAFGQDSPATPSPPSEPKLMEYKSLFEALAGNWEGTCRTWFQPGKLADESQIKGSFEILLDGPFLRHRYQSTIQGKPRQGEELIAFNKITEQYQITWIDDFHMNYAILVSEGKATSDGFDVRGQYDTAPGQPQWGWRTVLQLGDDDELTITAYNVTPAGLEAKAVETVYRKQSH